MAKIIKQSKRVTGTTYALSYASNVTPGAGFSFDCNEKGFLIEDFTDRPIALEAFIDCITGKEDVTYTGISSYHFSYIDSAILRCDCGEEVELAHFTNTCHECETDYSITGHVLAPREQWGEETGESWIDLINL